jgi:transposase
MQDEHSRKRRRYSRELKAQIVAECEAPGASVARVAMAHGVNANVVHGWRQLARAASRDGVRPVAPTPVSASQVFLPVKLAPPPPTPKPAPAAVVVELQRGPLTPCA